VCLFFVFCDARCEDNHCCDDKTKHDRERDSDVWYHSKTEGGGTAANDVLYDDGITVVRRGDEYIPIGESTVVQQPHASPPHPDPQPTPLYCKRDSFV